MPTLAVRRCQPHRQGTFNRSQVRRKVAASWGFHLGLSGGAVALSVEEKAPVQAWGRTPPMLPIAFDAGEERAHDYVRQGTTNPFAALDVGAVELHGEHRPTRTDSPANPH